MPYHYLWNIERPDKGIDIYQKMTGLRIQNKFQTLEWDEYENWIRSDIGTVIEVLGHLVVVCTVILHSKNISFDTILNILSKL